MSMPSYRSCATRIVRLEPNDSFFAASCWSVDVVNGADGFLRRSRRLTSVTSNVFRALEILEDALGFGLVVDLRLLAVDLMELGGELLAVLLEQRLDRPVLDRLERANLALALDDEPKRDGLHASGRQSLLDGLPQHRARLVADETIEHATRLLRFDLLAVDDAGVQDRALDRVLRDLVEEHALDRQTRRATLRRDLRRHVPGDRLALAIRVGGDQHFLAVLRRALQLGDRLFLAGDRNEVGREAVLDVDAELLLGQIHDVADRGANAVAAAEVLADRLRLGRRLDDDERARAARGAGLGLVVRHVVDDVGATALGGRLGRGFLLRGLLCRRARLGCCLPRGLFGVGRAFSLPCSVYRLVLVAFALLAEPRPFHEGAEVVQRDAAVDLHECPLDNVLELGSVQRAGALQCQQVPPGFRGETPAFMRAQNSKSHHLYLVDARTGPKARRGGCRMRVASILSLSNPRNSGRATRSWNGNVFLHRRRGKLDDLLYNPL